MWSLRKPQNCVSNSQHLDLSAHTHFSTWRFFLLFHEVSCSQTGVIWFRRTCTGLGSLFQHVVENTSKNNKNRVLKRQNAHHSVLCLSSVRTLFSSVNIPALLWHRLDPNHAANLIFFSFSFLQRIVNVQEVQKHDDLFSSCVKGNRPLVTYQIGKPTTNMPVKEN